MLHIQELAYRLLLLQIYIVKIQKLDMHVLDSRVSCSSPRSSAFDAAMRNAEMFESTEAEFDPGRAAWPSTPIPVGLVTTDEEIWVVVCRGACVRLDEIDRPAVEATPRMSICREVRSDGTLRIARMDVRREPFLNDVLVGT